MKKLARITSKGQITVPHEIRRALGVRPGDKLLFEKDRAGVRVRPVRANSPFEKYRGVGSPGIARGKKAVVAWGRKVRGGGAPLSTATVLSPFGMRRTAFKLRRRPGSKRP